jgi:hypothetical protein
MLTLASPQKHEPSKMSYYTFGDELTPLSINSLYFPKQMNVVYKKLTVQYKTLTTQVHFLVNEFYCTLEVQKCRSAEAGGLNAHGAG